jgi:hypothetical protein
METKYVKGHYKICKFIMKRNAANISVTDQDIIKATKLSKKTITIYRTKLVKNGFLIRSGSDFRSGRKRATWRCVKPLTANPVTVNKVRVQKVKTKKIKPQVKTDFQKGIKLFYQLLKLVEKTIIK